MKKLTKEEIHVRKETVRVFKMAFDGVYKSLETTAKEFDSKSVPLSLVKNVQDQYFKTFKKNMLPGGSKNRKE